MGNFVKFVLGWVSQGLTWGSEGKEASIIDAIIEML